MDTGILLLLAEDETLIQLHLQEELADAGFEVVAVTDGAQAIAELDRDVARFRGVLTDIRLGPGPDGWEVARHARELAAEIPVVYMSGDSAHEWSAKGVPKSVMLSKPFATAQLITAISTLLNQRDSH